MPDEHKEYDVGQGKPPKAYQFTKGKSGNPKGRPKKPKRFSREIADFLNEPVAVAKGDARRKIPAFEGSVRKLVQRAIKDKNLAAIIEFVKLCERNGVMKVPPVEHGGGVFVAPAGVDFHAWVEANTEIVSVNPGRDEDE